MQSMPAMRAMMIDGARGYPYIRPCIMELLWLVDIIDHGEHEYDV
jgi:hypothetical protein